MRHLLSLAILIFFFENIDAQAKYDNNWTLGYGKKATDSNGISGGGMIMSFDSSSPTILYTGFKSDRPAACISDRKGRFLAYTQGCSVWNRNLEKMLNGDSLNPGRTSFFYCPGTYPVWQGSLFLPMPGSDSLFYLLHIRSDDKEYSPINLLYTVIDATGDGGNGEVITKNNVILSDSLFLDKYVSATRHANGQDWWIMVPQVNKNGYHLTLLTPQGIEYKGIQNLGNDLNLSNCCTQAAFSADGGKFFKNNMAGLTMLDFNRCDGTLSNAKFLPYDSTYSGWGGVVTSPNSRYLYLLAGNYVSQFDLQAADVFATRQTVATYDGGVAPFPARFFQAQRGPDGKIYAVSTNSNNILHVIHSPDEPGLACNVEQRGLVLPALTGYILVNFANYRLDSLPKSYCDSLSGFDPEPRLAQREPVGLDVYPNPATDEATFEQLGALAGQGGSLRVSDLAGRLLWERAFQPGQPVLRWLVAGVPPGVYVWEYVRADGRRAAGRLAVQR